MKMMAVLPVLAAMLLSGAAQAVVLHDNGPVVDSNGKSFLLEPQDLVGWNNQRFRLADDFTVAGAAWTVESLSFFASQTDVVAFPFLGVTWSVIAGPDINSGSVVASGVSGVADGGLVGYRVLSSLPDITSNPIYRADVDVPDFTLTAGQYFLVWQLEGTPFRRGPTVTPVLGSYGNGNAMIENTGQPFSLVQTLDAQTAELPFTISGTAAVPEPAAWMTMLLGFGALGTVLRRRQVAAA